MPTFEVDIGKATYEVDAPDEATAWAWANASHAVSYAPKQAERGVGSELWRQGELALRAGLTGVAGIPQLLGGAMEAVAPNLLKGAGVNVGAQLANKLGLAQPESDIERVSQSAASAMAGGAPFLKAGQALQTAAPGVARRVGAVMAAQPAAQTALAGVSGGASEAAKIGGAGPVGQTVAGLVAPLAAAPVAAAVKGAGAVAKNIVAPLISEDAAERGAARLVARGLGERGQQVAQALKSASDEQTAGQIATALENTDLAALQSIANRTDQTFAEVIKQGVQERIKKGWGALEDKLAPVRQTALELASKGRVYPEPILNRITAIKNTRGNVSDQVISKSLDDLRERILSVTKDGVADPFELHTIRKQISSTIERFSKESATWDKKKAASLERQLQLGIDDAIEAGISRADPSQKGLWSDEYMKAYAAGAKTLSNAEDAITREAQLAAKGMPAIRRSIGATEAPITGLNLLNRVVTLTNAALRAAEGSAGTKVESALARLMAPKEQGGDVQKLGRLVQAELDKPKGFIASLRGEPLPSRAMLGYSALPPEPTSPTPAGLSLAPVGEPLMPPRPQSPMPQGRGLLTLADETTYAPKPTYTGAVEMPVEPRLGPLYAPRQEQTGLQLVPKEAYPPNLQMPTVSLAPEGRGMLSLADDIPATKTLRQKKPIELMLRQEVMQLPDVVAYTNQMRTEIIRLENAVKNSSGFWRKGFEAQLEATKKSFLDELKRLGGDTAADLIGLQKLYQGGGETKLPLVKQGRSGPIKGGKS